MNAPCETLQRPLALLASLPAGDAAALLERLPTSSIQRLIETLPHVPHVACQMPEAVAQALADEWGAHPAARVGPERRRVDRLHPNAEQLLASVDAAALAATLAAELPQTIAAVLRGMPVEAAANVLARLSSSQQLAVARRLATPDAGDRVALAQVCQAVAERVVLQAAQPLRPSSGVVMVARLLDHLDRPTERALLENLRQEDPLIYARLRLVRTLLARLRATRFVAERKAA